LISKGIKFLVSPDMLDFLNEIEFDWPKGNKTYKIEMQKRIDEANELPRGS
jgi:hypothetical protein